MKKPIIPLFIICSGLMRAQMVTPTVYATDGGYGASAQGSIAWTIGEPVSESNFSATQITTMGFQQPDLGLATLLDNQKKGEAQIYIYPNPVSEALKISFQGMPEGNYILNLIDDLGKLIIQNEASISESNQNVELKLRDVAQGNYFLVITSNKINQTIKFNKIN